MTDAIDNAARAFALAGRLRAQGQSPESAARTAVGLLKQHDRSHADHGARRGCPYCLGKPSPVKWA